MSIGMAILAVVVAIQRVLTQSQDAVGDRR
jgi:hypothetical protein